MENCSHGWVELQNFGWNPIFLFSIGVTLFALIRTWGLWSQSKVIWRKKSGESIPVTVYTYLVTSMITATVYGIKISSLSLVFSAGLLVLSCMPILVGLWKFKGFTRVEIAVFIGLVVSLLLMFIPSWVDVIFMIFSVGAVASAALQPIELLRKKKIGAVDIKPQIISLCNCIFWVFYSFYIDDLLLKIINPCFTFIFLAMVILWYYYRYKQRIAI